MQINKDIKEFYSSCYNNFLRNTLKDLKRILMQNAEMKDEQVTAILEKFKPQIEFRVNSYNNSKLIVDKKVRSMMEDRIEMQLSKMTNDLTNSSDNILDLICEEEKGGYKKDLTRSSFFSSDSEDEDCDNDEVTVNAHNFNLNSGDDTNFEEFLRRFNLNCTLNLDSNNSDDESDNSNDSDDDGDGDGNGDADGDGNGDSDGNGNDGGNCSGGICCNNGIVIEPQINEYEATLQILNASEVRSIATDKGIRLKNSSKKSKSKQELIKEILAKENN